MPRCRPTARAFVGSVNFRGPVVGHRGAGTETVRDELDSAPPDHYLICAGRQPPESVGPKKVSPRAKPEKSRADWATLSKRTLAMVVFRCPRCGGKRRVVQVLKSPEVVGYSYRCCQHCTFPPEGDR